MSIPVPLDELASHVVEQTAGYLLTTAADRPHVMHTNFEINGHELTTQVGRTATRTITESPGVTLVWPPTATNDHTLIVDGTATIDGSTARITALTAVLHRPA